MRGKLNLNAHNFGGMRITPAHAGKTLICRHATPFLADHPRTCGENHLSPRWLLAVSGSPPHMRGKLSGLYTSLRDTRITPAHAGKTETVSGSLEETADHPRTCGENFFNHEPVCFRSGSPPHMRGKRLLHFKSSSAYRITPAHAGKTTD